MKRSQRSESQRGPNCLSRGAPTSLELPRTAPSHCVATPRKKAELFKYIYICPLLMAWHNYQLLRCGQLFLVLSYCPVAGSRCKAKREIRQETDLPEATEISWRRVHAFQAQVQQGGISRTLEQRSIGFLSRTLYCLNKHTGTEDQDEI